MNSLELNYKDILIFSFHVTSDSMAVYVSVKILDKEKEIILPERNEILDMLNTKNIVFGISDSMIEKLIEILNTEKPKEIEKFGPIATGTPARDAEEGAPKPLVESIKNERDYNYAKECRYFWQIREKIPHIECVHSNTPIAEKQMAKLPYPGKNVYGVPVLSENVIPYEILLEEGVKLSEDKTKIISTRDGVAYIIGNRIGVLPLILDGEYEIILTDGNMTAQIIVHPPAPHGKMPEKEEIKKALTKKEVCFGIMEENIDTLYKLCQEGNYPSEPFIVAKGEPPKDGVDGRLEYHFNIHTSLTPKIDEKGHADFKSVNIVTHVKSKDILVTAIPPTKGIEGKDVLGRVIPAKDGKPVRLPQGPHTFIDKNEPNVLKAEIDGIVRLSGDGIVEICEGFIVEGDVDYSTGNIEYNKTVIVKGDVKAGFSIHCGGDLEVDGVLEDSHVKVGGNVLAKHGFIGTGKGIMEVKGNVNIGFCKNQTIRAFQNITIAKEALNCTLLSRGAITIYGNPLSVAGGIVKARDYISIFSAGNHTGIKTTLEAGVDFILEEEVIEIDKKLKELSTKCKSLEETLNSYRKMIDLRRRSSSIEHKKAVECENSIRTLKEQISILEERKKIIVSKMYSINDAYIHIEHKAYPGTLIRFANRFLHVKDEINGPKNIRCVKQEIKII
ncbi:MAG: FapA family protein [Chitinispirillaceae bacterium]|nr:FapA family protein [Chitinispirillaceae bacterium]